MTDDENTTQAAAAPDVPEEPVCSACGLPLHVLRGGLQVDGTSIVNVAILGCTNNSVSGTNVPCSMFNQEQSRNETPVNMFAG